MVTFLRLFIVLLLVFCQGFHCSMLSVLKRVSFPVSERLKIVPFVINQAAVTQAAVTQAVVAIRLRSPRHSPYTGLMPGLRLMSHKLLMGGLSSSLLVGGLIASPALAEAPTAQTNAVEHSAAMHELNNTFASAVIIPTYADLVTQTQTLVEAAAAFEADPSELTLYSLRTAWLSSASTWAQGNAFAFGPVHSLGHAAALEFPADPLGIESLMADAALPASNQTSGAELVNWDAQALLPSVQGFEAIAYLLHGPNDDKSLSDFSDQERHYVAWLARSTRQVSGDLLAVWQLGVDSQPAYETVLASAGEPGNGAYLSPESGTEEIVRGLINTLDVVSHEGLPAILAEPQILEQDAGERALKLLHSTLQGVQTAYLGAVAIESPVTPASVVEESVEKRAVAEAIAAEEITAEEIVANDSIANDSVADGSIADGSIADDSVASESVAAQPPVAEAPFTADSDRTGGLSGWVGVTNTDTDAQIQQSLSIALASVANAKANPRNRAAVNDALALAQSSLIETQTLLETDVLPLLQR